MASGQHNTQVRDWAVQDWKKTWSCCACSRVSSKFQPQPTNSYCHVLSWRKCRETASEAAQKLCSAVHDWGTYGQGAIRTETHTLEHSVKETCSQHRGGQNWRGWVVYSQNLQKLYQRIPSLNTSAVQQTADTSGFLFNDCRPSWESRWFPDETSQRSRSSQLSFFKNIESFYDSSKYSKMTIFKCISQ